MKQMSFAFAGVLLLGCMTVRADDKPPLPAPGLIRGNNAFAAELYGALKHKEGNLFFSPLSISSALAMTYAGARGETAAQMKAALKFPVEGAELHREFGAVLAHLNAIEKNGGVTLNAVHSLWPDKGYAFLPEFLKLLGEAYGADVIPVDYQHNEAEARKQINAWVESKTNDKIKELISSPLSELTRMVLVNAVYFKGDWAAPFKKERTENAPFHRAPGSAVDTPLMTQKGAFHYAETADCQMLGLPYAGNGQSMLVLLPKEAAPEGLAKLEASLTADHIAEWRTTMRKREVEVFLPKFKITWGTESLAAPLKALGMKDAFGAAADFSGMDGSRRLFVSDVLHKAFVDVNEEGTEAAAATAGIMALRSLPARPPVFRADHPFVFLILDDASGQILFMGRMANPA